MAKKLRKSNESMNGVDTSRPQMFSDEDPQVVIAKATKISDLKNLGPSTEKSFQKAGILTVPQFVKMGWKKAILKLAAIDPKNRHSLYAYALIGALTNTEWNQIPDSSKAEAKAFIHSLIAKSKPTKVKGGSRNPKSSPPGTKKKISRAKLSPK